MGERQLTGLRLVERSDLQVAQLRPLGPARPQLGEKGARLGLLFAIRHHEQERRGMWRSRQLEQQGGAVGVSPLDVVDEEDDWPSSNKRRKQLAQGRERSPSNALGVGDSFLGERSDAGHAPEDREEPREGPGILREREGQVLFVQTHQVAAQRVDHAVDGLVGHGLALVHAPPQDDRRALLHQLVEELLDQR